MWLNLDWEGLTLADDQDRATDTEVGMPVMVVHRLQSKDIAVEVSA